MNEMQIFQNEQFGSIRTVVQDGEPWFVAKDVCEAFGETNRNRAMQTLDDDEKGYTQMTTPGGAQEVAIVNEPGLYALLFAMQPEKARGVSDEYIRERQGKLRSFKRWVTHEVLPAIRKTGRYAAPGMITSALAEMHTAAELMRDILGEMKQAVPRSSSLDRVLAAKANGTLDAYHLRGHGSAARRLLDHEKIGRKITVYLIEEDISTEQLAAELGVSSNTVFRWRRGENAPAGERLEKLCEILGCKIEDLLR